MANKEIIVEKIFLKDSSIETPSSPDQFQFERDQIKVNMDCNVGHKLLLPPTYYEVVLELNVIGKDKEHFLYVINATYGGLFDLKGHTEEEREKAVRVECPTMLFPYAQQFISDISTKSGFHPAFLQQIDFEGLYEDKKN
jgi:preprotein translocase subunit SecB